ncbi:MAG: hypothetical protein GY749_02045 [Desulfobacteraceae bacterium]|nr:hypothetical protein [Desulfobacteraceae bacterium]
MKETFISYNELKNQYGMHIKNEDGEIIKKDGGFFAILGIKKDTKFKNYLGQLWELPLEKSLKGKDVISVYQGTASKIL